MPAIETTAFGTSAALATTLPVATRAKSSSDIVEAQRAYFETNATKPVAFRIEQLRTLKSALSAHAELLDHAIGADIGKSRFENLFTELFLVYEEIDAALDGLTRWARPVPVKTDPLNGPAECYVMPEPLGVSLIIGPWNYPYQLTLCPLVAAIAAGCTAIVKPSELMPHASAALARILGSAFAAEYIAVVEGGIPETTELLQEKLDTIFFTGSVPVGKIIYAAAAKHLTPVTLELGGKSPVIVMPDADLDVAARRIVWGKLLNAGQTCIAPDYVLVHHSIEDALVERLIAEIEGGRYAIENGNYVHIVNARNVERLAALLDLTKVRHGGRYDVANRSFEPTVMTGVRWTDRVMQEEIFGPILPVLSFDDLDDVIRQIKAQPKPLALYLFTTDPRIKARVLGEVSFGGGCVNDTIMHIANAGLPFGGVGDSGIGHYHGEDGFKAFSHLKSVVEKTFTPDVDIKYPPYTPEKLAFMEAFAVGGGSR